MSDEERPEELPKTPAERDYDEDYSSATHYYGEPTSLDQAHDETPRYDEREHGEAPEEPAESERSYERRRLTDDELLKLDSRQRGNNDWFAPGAGVNDEPFDRTWQGAGHREAERRILIRRDIAHDPFVRLVNEERRINGADRRSARNSGGTAAERRKAPARYQ